MIKIIMPPGGQTTDESTITKWHKNVGDEIKRGDVLFEIETDKAILEIESFGNGFLLERCYEEGETAKTGAVCAYIGEKGEEIIREDEADITEAPEEEVKETQEVKEAVEKVTDNSGLIMASPAARKLLKDENVDIALLAKEFAGTVIKLEQARAFIAKAKETVKLDTYTPQIIEGEDSYKVKTSNMRKTVARRLTQSVLTAPQFTIQTEIDTTKLSAYRKELNAFFENEGVKISFNDFIINAACKAIKKYPLINGVYGEDEITVYNNVNFGLAVATDEGLVVPVVKGAQKMSLFELSKANKKNIELAREGKAPMAGGTITLSNLGMYAVTSFTAILNPPESCILACGKINKDNIMTITATFDHRLIDGAYGAGFMTELKKYLDEPMYLVSM